MIVDIYKMQFKEISIKIRFYNYYFDYLVKKIETKSILIDEKNHKEMTTDFTRYDWGRSIRMSNLHYD